MNLSGTLPDGTRWRVVNGCGCFHPVTHCRGGQHVGPRPCWVLLNRDGDTLAVQSGLRSTHRTSKAMADATRWSDVPFLVEASRWRCYEMMEVQSDEP